VWLAERGWEATGVDFLPGALPFSPGAGPPPEADVAADVVWLDALVANVDRTARNPNLLRWHERLWLIDHGAALYWHHAGSNPDGFERLPFAPILEHVLLPFASSVAGADARLAPRATEELIARVVGEVPAVWLADDDPQMYVDYLTRRLRPPRAFAEEAERARR
jgi:hypothetical protein